MFPGGVAAYADLQRRLGPWFSDVNYPMFHQARSLFVINTTTYEVSPDLTIKNIFGYNNTRADDGFDYDGSPYPIFQPGGVPTPDATSATGLNGFIQGTKQISEEFQLQGKAFDNRLIYVLGAYYLNQKDENDSWLYAFDFSPLAPGLAFRYHQLTKDESKAVFAQGTYKVSDKLSFTGGVRYTWENQSAQQLTGSAFGENSPIETMSSSNPSWTVSLDYQLTPSLLVYITHRGSWRAGGYNYSVMPLNTTAANGGNLFDPETTKDVEVGAKYSGTDLGVPVTFNIDVYNQWVKNIQRAAYVVGLGSTPTLFTTNVPAAEITGVEVDGSVRPTPWLLVGASGAYTDARYTSGHVNLLGTPTDYGPFAYSPKWTGNLYAEISHDLAENAGRLTLHGEVYGQSKMFFSNVAATTAPFTDIAGYGLVNGRLTWAEMFGTRVTSALFVRNLLNHKYYTGGNSEGPSLGVNTSVPGLPRMFGAELRVSF